MNFRIAAIPAVALAVAFAVPSGAAAKDKAVAIQISKVTYAGKVHAMQMANPSRCGEFTQVSSSSIPSLTIDAARTFKAKGKSKSRKPPKSKIKYEDGKVVEPVPADGGELPPLQHVFGKFRAPLNGPTTQRLQGIAGHALCSPNNSYEPLSCNIDTGSTPMRLDGAVVGYRTFKSGALNATVELSPVIKGISNTYTQQATCGVLTGTPLMNGNGYYPCRMTLRLGEPEEGAKKAGNFTCADPTSSPFRDPDLDPQTSVYTASAQGTIEIEITKAP